MFVLASIVVLVVGFARRPGQALSALPWTAPVLAAPSAGKRSG
ncbi:MAG TPA: hypothetical protein VFH88_14365 [Candidatus Krumholzibacteria bacterium]|nr:hypothetical protein [Candidatus Krumholzibacteria bacterium]